MKEICVVIAEPFQEPEIRLINDDLKTLQSLVGGLIQIVPLNPHMEKGPYLDLIINEEGKFMDLEPNFYWHNDVIMGTAIVTGEPDDEGEMTSLSERDAKLAIACITVYRNGGRPTW